MPTDCDHPTQWEKLRDNVVPVLAIAIILGLFNMYGTQRSILEVLTRLEKRVDRMETRLDREYGNHGD